MNSKFKIDMSKKKTIVFFVFLISILFIVSGFIFYKYIESRLREEKHHELKAISDLKISQIIQWRKENIGNAEVLSKSPFTIKAVLKLLSNPDNTSIMKELTTRLLLRKGSYNYENIFLLSTDGKKLLDTEQENLYENILLDIVNESIGKKEIIFTDFYYCIIHKKIHYDLITPVIDKANNVIAVFVMRINPNDFLYPLIQSWPTPSNTSETMIVRREKDSVLYLNETRFLKNTTLKFGVPLTRTDIPSVQAVLGKTEIFEGKDYRGVNVLADIRPVPDTPWYMITKVDRSEIYSDLYLTAGIISGFVFVLILLTGAGFALIYSSRNKRIYQDLYSKEKELWQSQEKFKVTLDSIGDGVITTDIKGKIEYMNLMAENLTGWNFREARGRNLDEIYPIKNEETGNIENNVINKIVKFGIVKELANHTILITKIGSEIPVMDTGAPIYNSDGKIIGIVLAFQDESEKRKKNKLIRESEERLRSTMDSMLEGCQIISHDWRYLYVNDSVAKQGKTAKDKLIGKTMMEAYPGVENTEMYSLLKICMDERTTHRMENQFTFPDGSTGWFELKIQPVPEGIFILSNDITEQKRAVEEIIKAKEKAEEMNRLKSSFLANMSHELRTPMNGILGFTEIIKFEDKLDIIREISDVIHKSGKRLMNTLNSILNLARVESGELKPGRNLVNLYDVIYSIVEFFKIEADSKGIELKLNSEFNSLLIQSDERIITEVMNNIVSNAIKFTSEGCVIIDVNLEINENQENIIINITDTGIGIDENDYDKIFDEFRQVSEGLNRSFEGTGLGLTICKKYVEMLGGSIQVKSKLDVGSTFTIILPIIGFMRNEDSDSEIPDTKFISEEPKISHKINPSILYVEDDDISIQLVHTILSDFFEMDFVNNAPQAINKSKEKQYDLILMDINLGKGLNGMDATREIRKIGENKNTPIIAITAFAMKGDCEEFIEGGCTDYLSKPFERNDLMNIISKYINIKEFN